MNFFTNYNVVKNTEINKICSQPNKISTCRNIPNQQTFNCGAPSPAFARCLSNHSKIQKYRFIKTTRNPQQTPNRPLASKTSKQTLIKFWDISNSCVFLLPSKYLFSLKSMFNRSSYVLPQRQRCLWMTPNLKRHKT